MTERMLGIVRRSPASTPLAVYAIGVLALLLRPQEYEVEAVRYIATTELPETLLQRMQKIVQDLNGRAYVAPFPSAGGCPINLDTSIIFQPASVNEEVDNEEPKLSALSIQRCQLLYTEFLWSLDIVSNVSQYVDVLAPILQNGGIELMHFLLSSQSPVLVSYALGCLTSLVTHPKFATLFLARDGLMLLIAKPCATNSTPYPFVKLMSNVLNNLVQYASTIEQICLLTEQVHVQFLELVFWLLDAAQEDSLKSLMIALARLLVYETFVDIFHRQGLISNLLNKWKFFQAIVDGKLSAAQGSETVATRSSHNGFEIALDSSASHASPQHERTQNNTMDVDQISSAANSETVTISNRETQAKEEIPYYSHLKMTSPSSARSLVDHMFLVLSEYFAAACVQASAAASRRSSSTSSSISAAPTPRYRATNVSNEHMVAINFVHQHLFTLPDVTSFVNFGGLDLLFHTIFSNIPGVPNSQTCTDIVNAGLKLLWIFTALEQTADMIVNLSIQLPEVNQARGSDFARHIAARVHDLLRPDGLGADDIPIVHGLNWQGLLRRRGADADEEESDGEEANGNGAQRPANAVGGPQNNANGENGEGGGYMDRVDLTNIRLEPVNQRLILERNSSRLRSASLDQTNNPETATSSTSTEHTTAANSAAASRMDEDATSVPSAPATSDATQSSRPANQNGGNVQVAESTANPQPQAAGNDAAPPADTAPPAVRRRSSNWILLNVLRRISVGSPTSAVYILQIFNNYLHAAGCRSCTVFSSGTTSHSKVPSRSQRVAHEIRSLNGLSELVSLLKYHEISVSAHSAQHQAAAVAIDWNVVRTHAMSVLINLAHSDDAINQILSKKLTTTLPDILRAPSAPGQERSFAKFKDEALKFFATPSAAINFKRDEEALNPPNELSKLERASIIGNTPIRYSKQELLELIYQHLWTNGYHKAAESLAEDAKLTPEKMRPPPPPTAPKSRARRASLLGTASSSSFANTSATPVPSHPDAPVSENGFLSEAPSSQISLETIVKQFLYEQHRHCHHPVQVLPDLSLHSRHSCPDPIRHRMNPNGANSMNLAHRLMAHSLKHAPMRSAVWRQHKYSRFAPRRKFSDGGLLTSVTFVDNQNIYFGSGDGLVVRYNASSVNYEDEWEVREGPVDIKISPSSRRVLTMAESRSCIVGAPEDMKIWDLSNMGHDLGTLPFVTGQFSTSGQEVIGTGSSGAISLWDVSSGTIVRKFDDSRAMEEEDRSTRAVRTLQRGHFSPDDCLVLYNSTLWDKRKPSPIHSFDRFTASFGSQAFAPSGLEVITNTEIWDSRSFKLLKTVPSLHRASSITYSRQGDVLFCGSRSKFEVLDGTTYEYVSHVVLESAFASLSINPDDTQLAVLENLSPDHWPAESAWRIWDIGTSRTLDEEEGSDDENAEAEEDENAAALAEFDHSDDMMDEDDEDHHHHDDDEDDDDDGNAGIGRRRRRGHGHLHHHHHHEPFGFVIDGSHEEGEEDGEGGSSDMDEEDEEEEIEEWETDTDYMDEDAEQLVGSDGEPMYIIDDYDSEGEGLFDVDLDSDELAEISRQLGEEDDDANSSAAGEEAPSVESQPATRRRSGSAGSGGSRGGRVAKRASSVFIELPSDEDEANELLEHGNIAVEGAASSGDEADSEPSVMEFDDDGEFSHPSSSNVFALAADSSNDDDDQDQDYAEEEEVAAPRRSSAKRSGAKRSGAGGSRARSQAGRQAGRSVRGLPTLRELSQMLGLVPKRTGAANAEQAQQEGEGNEPRGEEDNDAQSPPPKKKPKRKD